jgi:hypothetical protein
MKSPPRNPKIDKVCPFRVYRITNDPDYQPLAGVFPTREQAEEISLLEGEKTTDFKIIDMRDYENAE